MRPVTSAVRKPEVQSDHSAGGFLSLKLRPLLDLMKTRGGKASKGRCFRKARKEADEIMKMAPGPQTEALYRVTSSLVGNAAAHKKNAMRTAAITICMCQNAGLDTSATMRRLEQEGLICHPVAGSEVRRIFSNATKSIRNSDLAYRILYRALNSEADVIRAAAATTFIRIGRDREPIDVRFIDRLERMRDCDPSPASREEAGKALESFNTAHIKSGEITR